MRKHSKKIVRFNKDDARQQMFLTKYWSREKEKLVLYQERQGVEEALKMGLSVIIDNTHFNPIHEEFYRDIAK